MSYIELEEHVRALGSMSPQVRAQAAKILGTIGHVSSAPSLIAALNDRDWNVREAAAEALGNVPDISAWTALTEALQDNDARVRHKADAVLMLCTTSCAQPANIATFLASLRNPNSEIRDHAANALLAIGKPAHLPFAMALREMTQGTQSGKPATDKAIGTESAVSIFLELFRSADRFARGEAVVALGDIGDEIAVPELIKALNHDNERLVAPIAGALGKIGGQEAVVALLRRLNNLDWDVSEYVRRTLSSMGPAAIPHVVRALEHEDVAVRKNAATIFGTIQPYRQARLDVDSGHSVVIAALCKALKDVEPEVRSAAAEALSFVGDDSAIPLLLKSFEDRTEYPCLRSALTLANLKATMAIPAIVGALTDEDVERRRAAADSLRYFKDPSTVPALIEALEDEDERVRSQAIAGLGEIGDVLAVPHLIRLVNDKSSSLTAAAEALIRIDDVGPIPRKGTDDSLMCRKVITDKRLSPRDRNEILESLRSVRHSGKRVNLDYRFLNVEATCHKIIVNGDPTERAAAQELIQWLNNQNLVRASEMNPGAAKNELLHSLALDKDSGNPEELLRATVADGSNVQEPTTRRKFWSRFFGK